jgi:hypothetical protein
MQNTIAYRKSDDDRCEYRFDENDVSVILVREGVSLLVVVVIAIFGLFFVFCICSLPMQSIERLC